MPVYDYYCKDCGTSFDVRRHMSESNRQTPCPHCGGDHTQRLIATVAIFSSGSDGQSRALAGMPSCAGCGIAPTWRRPCSR